MASGTVDVVYTWVDGDRPDYRAQLRAYASGPDVVNPQQFRDPAENLRFSLRSLERFFPAVGQVTLVTARPQVPHWLNLRHPRLRLVHHDQFFDDSSALPTFNSNVIESFLHRLPGDGRMLYLNDDYFLGAPCQPSDFWTAEGQPRVFGTFFGEVSRWGVYEQRPISFPQLEHGPVAIEAVEWAAALASASDDVAELRRHRFRRPDDLRPDRLYRWHLLKRRRGVPEPAWRYLRYARFVKLRGPAARLRRRLEGLAAARPKFFCLNDDLGPNPPQEAFAAVAGFLASYYPSPSSFERPVRADERVRAQRG